MNLQNELYPAEEKYTWKTPDSRVFYENNDIIDVIEHDHKDLNNLMDVLSSTKIDIQEKRSAYKDFSTRLQRHSRAEESSLYSALKDEKMLRGIGFEAQTEHDVAKRLIDDIDSTHGNDDLWLGKVAVLVHLVESHIKEEESDVFKKVKKFYDGHARERIGVDYKELMNEMIQRSVNNSFEDQDKHSADDGFSPI